MDRTSQSVTGSPDGGLLLVHREAGRNSVGYAQRQIPGRMPGQRMHEINQRGYLGIIKFTHLNIHTAAQPVHFEAVIPDNEIDGFSQGT